ncbi:hypothetical protein [Algibacter sp. R77976]|uniref:hypothetical protein n=1 Tax=Algibacter sp. R77976 TaxID=3093873 RepID=UPI0037C9FBB3
MKTLLNNINLSITGGCILLSIFLSVSCSSTKLISSWKNPDCSIFKPKKILVVGVTPNYEARKAFEFQLITELNARKIKALQSAVIFEKSFQDTKQTEKEIEAQVDKLLSKGYDTVLVSLVKGVNSNQSYGSKSPKKDYHLRKFIGYYLVYQEAYFKQDYYNDYNVFNIEASIYSLNKDSDKYLVWVGSFDLVDPINSQKASDYYVKTLIKILEKENIIPKQ